MKRSWSACSRRRSSRSRRCDGASSGAKPRASRATDSARPNERSSSSRSFWTRTRATRSRPPASRGSRSCSRRRTHRRHRRALERQAAARAGAQDPSAQRPRGLERPNSRRCACATLRARSPTTSAAPSSAGRHRRAAVPDPHRRGRPAAAAKALEALCAQSAPEALGERSPFVRSLRGSGPPRARPAQLGARLPRAVETRDLRARLRELYRDARDHTALAGLIAEEADRTTDRRAQLEHLREAALLHVEKRNDPASAVPLLERAVALDPTTSKLRLKLSQALHLGERYEEAAGVLRDQLSRYGARKPKDRAQVHFQLARVLIAAGTKPTRSPSSTRHRASILRTRGSCRCSRGSPSSRVSFDRAERMYRALLLTAGSRRRPRVTWKDGGAGLAQ